MKKIILSLCVLVTFVIVSCKNNAADKVIGANVAKAEARDSKEIDYPVMKFENAQHDFGNIINGTPVETVFKYTNEGNVPLVISNIKTTCGCTVPKDWSKEPLAPGASEQFTVKFNGKGANRMSKTITLTTNTKNGTERVKILAFIQPSPAS